jgi:Mg-chelatase subunit ChlI
MKKNIFPFTAIVGQEKIKKALILNAINPSIGGVLIKGDRGTGKTTAVRALADLLPELEVVENCPFNCDLDSYKSCEICSSLEEPISLTKKPMKVVELPLGATEDRIVGSLNIEKALNEGVKGLDPGILAEANRNILYIDEINLLDDHLVDVLLDAAAYGVNIVEREGISLSHPSNFILVGTMNPEEGELRGQLSDRIGLKITVSGINNIDDRIKIIQRREEFEKDSNIFNNKFKKDQKDLQKRIIEGRKLLKNVKISDYLLEIIARVCLQFSVEGHRSDISILKTSKSIAAFNNHENVVEMDLEEAINLVLGELENIHNSPQQIKAQIEKAKEDIRKNNEENSDKKLESSKNNDSSQDKDKTHSSLNNNTSNKNTDSSSNNNDLLNEDINSYSDSLSNEKQENSKNNESENDNHENKKNNNNNQEKNNEYNNKFNNLDNDKSQIKSNSLDNNNFNRINNQKDQDLNVNHAKNQHQRKFSGFENEQVGFDIKNFL